MNPYVPDTAARKKKKIAPTICIWFLGLFAQVFIWSGIIDNGRRLQRGILGMSLNIRFGSEADIGLRWNIWARNARNARNRRA
jgi:hypothetical protein